MSRDTDAIKTGPIRVFDSRKVEALYKEYKNARSQTFFVPPGYIGQLEVIAPVEYFPKVSFNIIREVAKITGSEAECFQDCQLGKYYRRWMCSQSLGKTTSSNSQPTAYSAYNSSIVYLGWNPFLQEIVEFEYIVRPGNYHVLADRCDDVLKDCNNPIIIELALIPVSSVPDLALPCNSELVQYRGQQNT